MTINNSKLRNLLAAAASVGVIGLFSVLFAGCGIPPDTQDPTTQVPTGQVYVSAGKVFTLNAGDNPAAVAGTVISPAATSMAVWQQSADPELSDDPTVANYSRLFLVTGGALHYWDTSTSNTNQKVTAVTQAVDSVGASSADGDYVWATHPNDAALSALNGDTLTVEKFVKLNAGRTPKQLAVNPYGYPFVLSGSQVVAVDLGGEIAAADVGAGATGIDASADYVAVANPAQGLLYVFDANLGLSGTVKVAGATKVTIQGTSAYVTSSSGASVVTSPILNTGLGTGTTDPNYNIIEDFTGQITAPAKPVVVTSQPKEWLVAPAGSRWIGPSADQSTVTRAGCCFQTLTAYELKFNLTGTPPSGGYDILFAADDYADIHFNGKRVYEGAGIQSGALVKFTLNSGFVSGTNTLDFVVFDSLGGPTGLLVSMAPAVAPGDLTQVALDTLEVKGTTKVGGCPADIKSNESVIAVANGCGASVTLLTGLTVVQTVPVTGDGASAGPVAIAFRGGDAVITGGGCSNGTISCSGTCLAVQSDKNNCGGCGIVCAQGQVCGNGTCGAPVAGGTAICNGVTGINLLTDKNNCGACGKTCTANQTCSNAACR